MNSFAQLLIKNNFRISCERTPDNVLRIVRIGVANSNRADIFQEWPMTGPTDTLFYINPRHSSNNFIGNFIDKFVDIVNYILVHTVVRVVRIANLIYEVLKSYFNRDYKSLVKDKIRRYKLNKFLQAKKKQKEETFIFG